MRLLSQGFTLVELMVTLVIAVVLMTVAVPSMMGFYEASRADNEISRIEEALKFARNQSISYGAEVRVSALQSSNITDWSNGIRIVLSNKNETLRLIEGIKEGDKISADRSFIVFYSNGLVNSSMELIYCPKGESEESRSVTVSSTGIVKPGSKGLACN